MNLFNIKPNPVVIDQGLDVVRPVLCQCRMPDGGCHCITLDIRRTGTLQ
jgi:hypothetical protein